MASKRRKNGVKATQKWRQNDAKVAPKRHENCVKTTQNGVKLTNKLRVKQPLNAKVCSATVTRCIEKTKIKKKEAGYGRFFKKRTIYR